MSLLYIDTMRFDEAEHPVYYWLMAKARKNGRQQYRVTHIRDWREYRDYTLKQVEHRMEKSPGETLITAVSIGRIERGLQPYTQPILEALAKALNCSVWELLEVNPKKQGEVVDLLRSLRKMDESQIKQLGKIAKAIA